MWHLLLALASASPQPCDPSLPVQGGAGWCIGEDEALELGTCRVELPACREEVDALEAHSERLAGLLDVSLEWQATACESALERAQAPRRPDLAIGVGVGAGGVLIAALVLHWSTR